MQPTSQGPVNNQTSIAHGQPENAGSPNANPQQTSIGNVHAVAGEALPITTQHPAATTSAIPVSAEARSRLSVPNPETETARQLDEAGRSFFSRINIRSWFSRRSESSTASHNRSSIIGFFKRIFTPQKTELTTAIVALSGESRFKQSISPYSASSSSNTWQKFGNNPEESDDLREPVINMDASFSKSIKDFFGRITGGILTSGDGYGHPPGQDKQIAIADTAKEACHFMANEMSRGKKPQEFTKEKLEGMVTRLATHLTTWVDSNYGNVHAEAATNIAAMRLFDNEDGTSQLVGVNLGNQRLLAINAQTGEVVPLNNLEGKDDCDPESTSSTAYSTGKTFVGGNTSYDADDVETINHTLKIPAKDVILVTLTDGAWQNFKKGVNSQNESSPFTLDCDALKEVIMQNQDGIPLTSQTVMQKLEAHLAVASYENRKQEYAIAQQIRKIEIEDDKLSASATTRQKLGEIDKATLNRTTDLLGKLDNSKYTLTRMRAKRTPEQIEKEEADIANLEQQLGQLPLIARLHHVFRKPQTDNWSTIKMELEALQQEIQNKRNANPNDPHITQLPQNIDDLIEEHMQILKAGEANAERLKQLKTEQKLISKALDDATITTMSPFGPRNVPTAPASSPKKSQQAALNNTITQLKQQWDASHAGNIEVIVKWRDPQQHQTNAHVLFESAGKSSPFLLAATMYQSKIPEDFEARLQSSLEARAKFTPSERLYIASQAPIPHPLFLKEMESIAQALERSIENDDGADITSNKIQLEYAQRQIAILKDLIKAYEQQFPKK